MKRIHEIDRMLQAWRAETPTVESRCYFVIVAERTADGSRYYNDSASGEGLLIAEAIEHAMEENMPLKMAVSTAVERCELKRKYDEQREQLRPIL